MNDRERAIELLTDAGRYWMDQAELARAERDGYKFRAERAEMLLSQTIGVCERRTAELVAARAGTEAPSLLTEINGLSAKISELEDTLAATLENWESYAAEPGGDL